MLVTEHNADVLPDRASVAPPPSLSWKQIVGAVDPFLHAVQRRLAGEVKEFDPEIAVHAEYALTNQGKQLRPALVALSAQATGTVLESHILVAVIIEMVHLATLVHDDVIDEAELRRRQPTLAAHWGNHISVLLGDILFAHALKLATGFPTTDICRAVASATKTVCTGEILQTLLDKNFGLERADYFKVLRMKTGELFALACDLGAYFNNAPSSQRAALRQYGLALGTAYQVFDDCLDLFGTESAAGKSLGTDLAKGKLTLPMLVLLDKLPHRQRARVQSLVRHWQTSHWPEVSRLLRAQNALGESQHLMEQYLDQARHALASLPASESRAALLTLADYLGQQTALLGHAPA